MVACKAKFVLHGRFGGFSDDKMVENTRIFVKFNFKLGKELYFGH